MRLPLGVPVSSAYFDTINNDCSTPEKTLLAAIVWRAYWDLMPNVESANRITAIRFFESKERSLTGFTYADIIDILELSAAYQEHIRKAVYRAEVGLPQETDFAIRKGLRRAKYHHTVSRLRYRVNA